MKRSLLVLLAACGSSQSPPPPTTSNHHEPPPATELVVEAESVESAPAPPNETSREHAIRQAREAGILSSGSGSGSVPSVSSGPPTATTRDKPEIRRVIRTKIRDVQYCYEKELVVDATLQGMTTIAFTIEADGTVSSSAGLGFNANVDACVAAVVKSLVFPAAPGATNVKYPFRFRPAPDGE